jgi:uncharacterized phage infection (PIP) family protein YhgE
VRTSPLFIRFYSLSCYNIFNALNALNVLPTLTDQDKKTMTDLTKVLTTELTSTALKAIEELSDRVLKVNDLNDEAKNDLDFLLRSLKGIESKINFIAAHPVDEKIENFAEGLNNLGAFAPLTDLRHFLDTANDECKKSPEYSYFKGLVDGRAISEELGQAGQQ